MAEDFENWYDNQNQRQSVPYFKDLSICTDGIFTFKNLQDKSNQKTEVEIIDFLLIDEEGSEFNNFLDRKIRSLKEDWYHFVTDDLAIIRVKTS